MALLKALCWALIFILRIRFPPGTSIATVWIKYDKKRHAEKVYACTNSPCNGAQKGLDLKGQCDGVYR